MDTPTKKSSSGILEAGKHLSDVLGRYFQGLERRMKENEERLAKLEKEKTASD